MFLAYRNAKYAIPKHSHPTVTIKDVTIEETSVHLGEKVRFRKVGRLRQSAFLS